MIGRLHAYELSMRSPMATSHAIVRERRGALFQLAHADVTGWGDVCPMPGWSAAPLDPLVDRVELAALRLDDGDVAAALAALTDVPEGRAAIAGAHADLLAQVAGVPLATSLAVDALDRVAVNATIGAADVSTALTSVNLAVASGFTTFKLKVGHRSLSADVALVDGARRAVGPEAELRLDANGGWRPDEALAALAEFAPYDIAFCEEPTAGIDAIAAVGRESAVPVAVDESVRSIADLTAALATRSIAVAVVKPQALGGPDIAMEAIRLAQASGVTPIITSMIDSAVGVAHAVHVAAASGVTAAHGLATSALLSADVAAPLAVAGGHITVPNIAGLGVRPASAAR